MSKYQVFMKGEGCSIRRSFESDEDEFNLRYLFDEECSNENVEIQWIKVDGKNIDIDKFGSQSVDSGKLGGKDGI